MVSTLIQLVIYIVVVGVIFWLLRYLIANVPMDEPFRRIANIALTVIGVLIVVLILLNFLGFDLGVAPRAIR